MDKFPILETGRFQRRYVPWSLIAAHEGQALQNHCGQSLEKLASRGGLSPEELWLVCHDMPWRNNFKQAEASAQQWLLGVQVV